MSPSPQPRRIEFEGKIHEFPADATDADIQTALGGETAPAAPNPSMNARIGPTPQPTNLGGRIANWASDAAGDIKYGGDKTIVGRTLKTLGATPAYSGVSPRAADYMASPALGPLQMVQGAGELAQPGKRIQGLKDIGTGTLNTGQIPLSFVGPEVASDVVSAPGAIATRLLPSAERSGAELGRIKGVLGPTPIDLSGPGEKALEISDLANKGRTAPKVINQFVKWTTDPNKPPLGFSDARDFYSAASSKLSPEESQRITPLIRYKLGDFTNALGNSLQTTAAAAGEGENYAKAMREYRNAMRLKGGIDLGKDVVKKALLPLAGGGALGYGIKKGFGQ
jgi:hypothetical protein